MALLEVKYRVHYTEHERGWGSRPDGYKDFETKEEAVSHYKSFNAKNNAHVVPDWYMTASYPQLVDKNGKTL